jgi:hypothetical protein
VDFRLNLGLATSDRNAGWMWLQAQSPSSSLATPAPLAVPFERPGVWVLTNGSGAIQQVLCPQGLVNVATNGSYEYHLECFYAANVGSLDTNGFYTTNTAASRTTK